MKKSASSRQTNLNRWKNTLESRVSDILEQESPPSRIKLSYSKFGEISNTNTKTLRTNGFFAHLDEKYESCSWKKWHGMYINPEKFMEERKEEMEANQE